MTALLNFGKGISVCVNIKAMFIYAVVIQVQNTRKNVSMWGHWRNVITYLISLYLQTWNGTENDKSLEKGVKVLNITYDK